MYWQSKRRHDCATSASEFLAPVALVRVSPLRFATVVIFTWGREREGVQAVHSAPPQPLIDCQCGTFLPRPSPSSLCGTVQ